MSGGRKNDPHVPLGPARRLVPRLFERHAFFDIGGYIRPSEKPKSSGRTTKMRETLCCMLSQSRFRARRRFFPFFRMRFSPIRKRPRNKKQLPPRVLWRPPSSLAYTLRLAQRRHAEIEQNGALGPDDRSRRSLPATRGTVPASIATASPPRRAIACRPARFLPPTPTETDRCPPPAPRPQEAIFPEALKSLKEADPDVYALVQKEKLRQMCVQAPTRTNATRSRAIDAMASCHTTDFPISLIISRLACGIPRNDD
jgi:hypothetical protein